MAPDKNARSYKLHVTNAFSGQLLLVSKRSKPQSPAKGEQPAADSLSIVVNDSGSEMQSMDNTDPSSSEGFSQDEELKCLKNICIKSSKHDTKSVKEPIKKPVGILKPSLYDTDASDSDAAAKSSEAKAALPKKCKKKQKKNKKKATTETESSVAESTDSVDVTSGESTSASNGESVAAAASDEESSKEESGAEGVAASTEETDGTQIAEDASIDEESEGTQTADAPSINEQSDGTQTAEDPSINEKSEGTQTGDDEKPAEEASSTSKPPSAAGDGWTPSKDALLRSMKDGGEAWSTIASAISMHKNSCKARWKQLSANGDGSDDKKEPGDQGKDKNDTSDDVGKATEAEAAPTAAVEHTTLADNNVVPGDTTANDADNEVSTADNNNNKKHKRKKKAKLSEKVKKIMKEKNMAKATAGSDAGASSAPSGGAGRTRVATWLGIHGPYYASVQVPDPAPGNGWTAEDCAVLGTLERKRRVERWLNLQANFYNATGRMVSIELLKDKVGDEA
ncbi:hypothetical protein PpBr36_01565 [Pyricularia pennisetigena]|uniref:hypothetical protein n=1 Tax=Pyricularia pennisetigena TaxID=1578925 RepID=UPI0011517A82|nr:hypothetical protein PpBr36_01565 [Pyricularia pennisetigena]TLS29440.1 hypothetical protein PpBr36_01565 [Pyricularia pennisetigena]